MAGFKFLRQFPIGAYFADFACREARLVIEIDGGTHGEDHEVTADQRRAAEIERLGYKLVRVSNRDVYDNIEGVLEGILAELLKR